MGSGEGGERCSEHQPKESERRAVMPRSPIEHRGDLGDHGEEDEDEGERHRAESAQSSK